MLKNYFLVSFRSLVKNRVYALLNIFGLAVGITCSMLILLWVHSEVTYDRFFSNYPKVYQLWASAKFDGASHAWLSVPLPTYQALKQANHHTIRTAVTDWGSKRLLATDDVSVMKQGLAASEEFPQIFPYELLEGDRATMLADPNGIVVTESTAKALFGNEPAIGKMVKVDEDAVFQITGIFRDLPDNASVKFDFLFPWKYREIHSEYVKSKQDNWGDYSFQVFVELDDPAFHQEVEQSIAGLLQEHGETGMEQGLFIYPMSRWRLYSVFENGKETGGLADYVKLFSWIAALILLIACINFMNMATARSEKRAKEVGIRKSMGSSRKDLIGQFLGESMLVALIAFLLAVVFTELLMPFYNQLVEKQLAISYTSPLFWIFGVSVVLLTGLLSGSYPALYLSGFQPAKVLKGKVKVGKSAVLPRKILVIVQFGFSIMLFIGSLVIYDQIQLVKNRQLGYDQENLITMTPHGDLVKNFQALKNELISEGVAVAVTRSNSAVTTINSNNFLEWPGMTEGTRVLFTTIATEYDYTTTMGIKVLEGRDFSEDFPSDSNAIIVNKAAMDIMQLPDPLGTPLTFWGKQWNLVGVVDDVLMGSAFQPVKPMLMVFQPELMGSITVRLSKSNDLPATMARVESIFKKHNPAYPFDYQFVDQEFQKKFSYINLTSTLANVFTALALLITGLGLFGLAAFMAERRTKEIGVRKVLGASVASILLLMSKDFSKLVALAFLITAPIAWYFMDEYLNQYQIRTSVSWWVFVASFVVALIFSLLVVSFQSLKAAHANPVQSLKTE
jgi:ABC-type antimicrobial peptide transport system permease subunit